MIFRYTKLDGVFIVQPEPKEDERGWFARTFCSEMFADLGLSSNFVQCSASFNRQRSTLRGLHYQDSPHPEAKLVSVNRGSAFDVVVDLRPTSSSYGEWMGVELTQSNRHMIYIPEGCAHGFQTLIAETEIFYQISETYHPELSRGIRWSDADLDIRWPLHNPVISDRDRNLPLFSEIKVDMTPNNPVVMAASA
jgi:dTDP-4-dehydrorhamnose 3,5-epimerase